MKNKIFLEVLPFLIVPFIIGSGFSLFIFNNEDESSVETQLSINVADNVELGNLYLLKENKKSSDEEKTDASLKTNLQFDFDTVFFSRSDNDNVERSFYLYYVPNKDNKSDFDYSKIELNCDISIFDSKERGIKETTYKNGKAEYPYSYSDSLIDYLVPTSFYNGENKVSEFSDSENENMVTYSSIYGISVGNKENIFDLKLKLKYRDLLSPSLSQNNSVYLEMMNKIKSTITDTKITLEFYLSYNG